MSRGMQAYAFTNRARLISIMIESGASYFATQLIFVVLYGMSHPGIFIVIPMAVQVYVRIATLYSSSLYLSAFSGYCIDDNIQI